MNEKTITNGIIKKLNRLDGVKVRKRFSNGSTNGHPDITGTMAVNGLGVRVEIEVKQPGRWPTKLQFYRLKEYEKMGACVFWADDVDLAVQSVEDFRHGRKKSA